MEKYFFSFFFQLSYIRSAMYRVVSDMRHVLRFLSHDWDTSLAPRWPLYMHLENDIGLEYKTMFKSNSSLIKPSRRVKIMFTLLPKYRIFQISNTILKFEKNTFFKSWETIKLVVAEWVAHFHIRHTLCLCVSLPLIYTSLSSLIDDTMLSIR